MTRSRKSSPSLWVRRYLFYFSVLLAPLIPVVAAVLIVDPGPGVTQSLGRLEAVDYRLRNLVLGVDGVVIGSRGRDLYHIVDNGNRAERWASFPAIVQGVHVTASGAVLVATDDGPRDPTKPCTIYRLEGVAAAWQVVLILETATALSWSLASSAGGALFVGEYGPKQAGLAHRVWKSLDQGQSWNAVFRAPARDGVHIHRVAVDPFSDEVWITVGDGSANRGAWRSGDGGDSFEQVLDTQATGVAFTRDAVYWGEDHRKEGRITRLDRASGQAVEVLRASRHGPYGGSIYDMTATGEGTVYAATMKYASQPFTATLWRGQGRSWQLVAELPTSPRDTVGVETIAGPDRDGWIYLSGYKLGSSPGRPSALRVSQRKRRQNRPSFRELSRESHGNGRQTEKTAYSRK